MVSHQAAPHGLQQNCVHALANTKKSLRNDGERGYGWLYQNLTSQENTQKNAKEKNTKAKIEAKWPQFLHLACQGRGDSPLWPPSLATPLLFTQYKTACLEYGCVSQK